MSTTHTHEAGAMCGSSRAGHDTLPIQLRVAAASPSGWRDALIGAVAPDGWVALHFLDGTVLPVWHHVPALVQGEAVAYHPASALVAIGDVRVSVATRP